jgi:hypothetical protein
MNNLLIISLLIFIIFCIIFYLKKMKWKRNKNLYFYEKYENYINPFFKNKSFCTLDIDTNKCKCTYQKDSVNIPFNTSDNSCTNSCVNKSKESCNNDIVNKDIDYYCKHGNQCKKYIATTKNKYISNNNCGFEKLTNQLILPYLDRKSCISSINSCDKYNSGKKGQKNECLKNTNCGYCTNKYGDGKCIEGTASGPLDLQNNCTINGKINKYEYGNFLF